ncbi:Membrane-anchored protein OS=Bosea thiooxidans OX=53254 GN=SAMN05660750_01343 PE=4 SV=1 [Bosea thiooxidans]
MPHADLDMRLALRITGLPGARPTALPNVFTPSTVISGRKVEDYRLPVELLRAVANVSLSPIEPSFPTVRFLELEDRSSAIRSARASPPAPYAAW